MNFPPPSDASRDFATGGTRGIDCENTLLHSNKEEFEAVGIGLRKVVAIAMTELGRAQDIKKGS